ncbi:MAG TPA: hypothetical protein VMD31_15530 [Opitutaceae bacterium]|nr:hypothetical protein [Opitutaceae bacterium]
MPRIKTTPTVRFALWALRLYLLVLLVLIGIKFVRLSSGPGHPAVAPAPVPARTAP